MPVSISGVGSISGLDQGFNVTTGSIGIGTVSPASILHASGSSDQTVTIQTTTAGADSRINFRNSGGTDAGGIHYKHNGNHLTFLTGGSLAERLRITSAGNIGIGTDNPQSLLSLHQSGGGFEVNANSGSNNARLLSYDRPAGVYREMTFQALSYVFETGGTEKFRIKSDGYLGINQNSPLTRLDVKQNNGVAYNNRAQPVSYGAARFLNESGHTSGGTYTGFQFNITGDSQNRICSMGMITEASNSRASSLVFHTDDGGNRTEKLRITSGGQLNFGGDLTQTGFTASITRNSSETDILRLKGNGGNAFLRFEDNDASSSFTLGADDAVGSGGFALYDRSDSAYRVVVDTNGRVSINATSPVTIGGQTPYLYVSSYTNLDGLRIRGLDTGNTLWKTGGDMSLTVASNDAINLKTNGTTRFVLNANSNNSTTLSIGNGSNLTNNTSPDRTSVKVGGTLHLEGSFQGPNHRTGMYYNCYASGQNNFYQGTFGANSFDYRAAAATMKGGAFQVYTDPSTSTNYSAGAQITTMKETLTCANGFVTAPNQPCFWATSNTGGSDTSNGYTGIISNQFEAAYVNIGNHFNTSNGVFTCPVAGTYEFHGQGLARQQGGDSNMELTFHKNGANVMSRSYGYTYVKGSNDHDNLHVMAYITCAANDQIDLRVYAMDSGIDCYFAQGLGYFAGRLVQ